MGLKTEDKLKSQKKDSKPTSCPSHLGLKGFLRCRNFDSYIQTRYPSPPPSCVPRKLTWEKTGIKFTCDKNEPGCGSTAPGTAKTLLKIGGEGKV